MLGTTEIIIIVGVGLVLFGASAIPKFARSLGRAKKEFEAGVKDIHTEEHEEQDKKKIGKKEKEGEKQSD